LLVVSPPVARAARDRLHAALHFLGYGSLGVSGRTATWISPHESSEVDGLLVAEGARAERFTARHDGDSQALLARAWDLEALARAYRRFLDAGELALADARPASDVGAYARRSQIVHEWRKFLFLDPGLPRALLPVDWPGGKAAEWFGAEAARLLPAATRYVQSCLEPDREVYDDG
ncbi:MAG: PaaX family transcriptional regulator C-terminal domain-containing protein, partial [Mycobacteriales bacterium]